MILGELKHELELMSVAMGRSLPEEVSNDPTVVLVGASGAGKTTLINFLLGEDFQVEVTSTRTVLFLMKEGKKIRLDSESVELQNLLQAHIGTTGHSSTIYPATFRSSYPNNGFLLCDMPGFNDNRGKVMRIIAALGMETAVKKCRNLNTVAIVFNYQNFTSDTRFEQIISTLDSLKELVRTPDVLRGLNLKVVFSQMPSSKFGIAEEVKQEIVGIHLPRIKQFFAVEQATADKRISDLLKSEITKRSIVRSVAMPKSDLLSNLYLVKTNSSTSSETREEIERYENKSSQRQIQLGILEVVFSDPSNIIFPDIESGRNGRDQLFQELTQSQVTDQPSLSFVNALPEIDELKLELLQGTAIHEKLIRDGEALISEQAAHQSSVDEYKSQLASIENQLATVNQDDTSSAKQELIDGKQSELTRLRSVLKTSIEKLGPMPGEIVEQEQKVAAKEAVRDNVVLHEIRDFTRVCGKGLPDCKKAWFGGHYLEYTASLAIGFEVDEIKTDYTASKADSVHRKNYDPRKGSCKIKYIGNKGKDSDLKVSVYAKERNRPGFEDALTSLQAELVAKKKLKGNEEAKVKITGITIEEERNQLDELRTSGRLDIENQRALLTTKLAALRDNLTRSLTNLDRASIACNNYFREHMGSVSEFHRTLHFINTALDVVNFSNNNLVSRFFEAYERNKVRISNAAISTTSAGVRPTEDVTSSSNTVNLESVFTKQFTSAGIFADYSDFAQGLAKTVWKYYAPIIIKDKFTTGSIEQIADYCAARFTFNSAPLTKGIAKALEAIMAPGNPYDTQNADGLGAQCPECSSYEYGLVANNQAFLGESAVVVPPTLKEYIEGRAACVKVCELGNDVVYAQTGGKGYVGEYALRESAAMARRMGYKFEKGNLAERQKSRLQTLFPRFYESYEEGTFSGDFSTEGFLLDLYVCKLACDDRRIVDDKEMAGSVQSLIDKVELDLTKPNGAVLSEIETTLESFLHDLNIVAIEELSDEKKFLQQIFKQYLALVKATEPKEAAIPHAKINHSDRDEAGSSHRARMTA